MSPIGLGVLGFAHGHVNMYLQRWRERPELGIRVVAGWDHDADRLAKAERDHCLGGEASASELLSRSDIDAVVIAAETTYHADLVEQAAAAGKTIVLQKPIALTMEQAERIVAAVDHVGVRFTMAWQMREDPHNRQIKELLASGSFGRIFQLRRRHCLATQCMKDFDKSWHVNSAWNRDIFADDAAHPIDFIYWLLGMPASVSAELGTLLNPAIPNDHGVAIFRYPDGILAEVSCSFVALAGENVTEVVCEKGVIIQNYGDGPSCRLPRPKGAPQLKWCLAGDEHWTVSDLPEIRQHGDRIYGLAVPLAAFLRGDRPPIATAEEGRAVLRMVLACYESAAQGRRILLR